MLPTAPECKQRNVRAALVCVVMLALLPLAGCSPVVLRYRGEDEAMSEQVIRQLRAGELDAIQGELNPSLIDNALPKTMGQLQSQFPDSQPTSKRQLAYKAAQVGDWFRSVVTTEYGFEDGTYVLTSVTLQRGNGRVLVIGLHAKAMPESLEQQNRFTFSGKRFWNDLMLLLMGACLGVSIYALVVCIRSRLRLRSKWLWAIACLVGVGQLTFNWTSGGYAFRIIWLNLPVASVGKADASPWYLMASFPLGALLFLARRRVQDGPAEGLMPENAETVKLSRQDICVR